jgi:DNA-binding protein Fis
MNLRELKKRRVLEVLEQVGGNKLRAAQILGIDQRTLYRILQPAESAEDKTP